MKTALIIAAPVVFLLALAANKEWELTPKDSTQTGYRGTGIVELQNPSIEQDIADRNQPPEPFGAVEPEGDLAGDVYENVQVLNNLSDAEFNWYMAAVTQWVSPEEGCVYCHDEENLASDSKYQKIVARRMMQMTQTINTEWNDHVGPTGVNCFSCHRGNNVPQYVYTEDDHHPAAGAGFAASRNNQNLGTKVAGFTSMPYDAIGALLTTDDAQIRVQSANALPTTLNGVSIQDTETTYSLMMNISQGLGVNCTYCHNTRSFSNWGESSPARVKAWHGINMVQTLNGTFLEPLASVLPDNRLGPKGDAPKAKCETCHQGIPKPMYGANMVEDHPRALATVTE